MELIPDAEFNFSDCYKESNPKPIINFEKKIALFFSAKSGCTFAVKWFFYQTDHLKAALDYHHFVHRYRNEVYMKSNHFKKSELDFIRNKGEGYLNIKVIRNPFERAVSSFMHFLFMLHIKHPSLNKEFSLNPKKSKYSFSEFVDLLSNLTINRCNIHWKLQYQLIERHMKIDHTFLINNSLHKLSNLEILHNLKKTENIKELSFSNHHSIPQQNFNNKFCGKIPYDHNLKLNRPDYKSFYNHELEHKIVNIYCVDFYQYKISQNYL